METDFVTWLLEELNRRSWDQADLSRRGRLGEGTVSRVISRQRGPGIDFLRGVAMAMQMPLETVLRRAGWLPPTGEITPEIRAWNERLMMLSEADRAAALEMMERVLRFAEDRPQYHVRRTRSDP